MAARAGPSKVRKYSDAFKLTAVRMTQLPGMQVKTVAAGLDLHPFMLSRWRKDVRDGVIRGRLPRRAPSGAYSGQSGQRIRFKSARRSGSMRPARPVHIGDGVGR